MLTFNPKKRFDTEQSLGHVYVKDFRSPKEEIVCEKPIFINMDDNTKFTIKEYREALYADISKRKKE